MAFVIDFHDDDVLALLQLVRHVEVERGETTDVVTHMVSVHVDVGVVVHGSEVEQRAPLLASLCGSRLVEPLHEPNSSFVEEQSLVARVPIGRNLHGFSLVEVVFDEVLRLLWLCVAEESPARRVHSVVVIAFFLNVNDIVPGAIERGGVSSEDVSDLRHLLCHCGKQCYSKEHHGRSEAFHVYFSFFVIILLQ